MIVIIDHLHTFELSDDAALLCGRMDNAAEGIVGLDPLDRSISRRALAVEHSAAGWTVTNTSGSQMLHVEREGPGELLPLPPGGVHVIDPSTRSVEVRGSIRTHRLDFLVPDGEARPSPTTKNVPDGWEVDTLTDEIDLTENERLALAAVFRGYLQAFPRRDCEPLSYAEAAALVGLSPTALRRRVERVRARLRRNGVFVEGMSAKHQLARYLIEHGHLSVADLALLEET